MAFSIRKMLSNINYFKKPGEEDEIHVDTPDEELLKRRRHTYASAERSKGINYEKTEPDSTQCTSSLHLPSTMASYGTKKGSLSDTDLLMTDPMNKEKKKCKKLRLDVDRANEKDDHSGNSSNVENTPKHALLDCKSSEIFSERFKGFDFNKSFDIFDEMTDERSSSVCDENIDIESLSESSDTDISLASDVDCREVIKMCRKVEPEGSEENQLVPSATPESFGDVEMDKNEEDRITLLLNYQMKLEKLECFLKKLLNEFQFHIEVSKVFNCRSIVTTLPGTNVKNIPKILGEVTYIDNISRGVSPTGSWNIVMEKEDQVTKFKVKKQMLSMKHCIDEFVNVYLNHEDKSKKVSRNRRSITFDFHKGKRQPTKRLRISHKKKIKHFDFPDFREAMISLFSTDNDTLDATVLVDYDDEGPKCHCQCHCGSPSSQTDSGLTTKNDRSISSQSITSSLGNFSLDSSTLTAYSESLDQIVSYNSFQDTSLYSTLLQKAAIERITFYVQVHSIQLKSEQSDKEFESKNMITFYCPSCQNTETEENGLLKHILSQKHCEKIHFLYKTAYIKKCMSSGKEIQPSTVLNPMKMYRDDNKIVCFGDAMYACSLCFENLIVGESILMAHCAEVDHVDRRDKLCDILD